MAIQKFYVEAEIRGVWEPVWTGIPTFGQAWKKAVQYGKNNGVECKIQEGEPKSSTSKSRTNDYYLEQFSRAYDHAREGGYMVTDSVVKALESVFAMSRAVVGQPEGKDDYEVILCNSAGVLYRASGSNAVSAAENLCMEY